MSLDHESGKHHKTGIVGGGKACVAILRMLEDGTLGRLGIEIEAVADPDPMGPGVEMARRLGIPFITHDFRELYAIDHLELLIEVTGDSEIRDAIERDRPRNVTLMDHVGVRLFWELHESEEARIRERKLLQERVEAERRRIAQIFDSIPDEIVVLDTEMVIQDANAAFLRNNMSVLGQPLGCRCYEVDQEVRGPCQVAVADCPFFQALETRRPASIVRKHFDDDGEVKYAAIVAGPIVDAGGTVAGVVEMTRDITSRIELEKDHKATEVQLREFLDHAPLGACVKNLRGQYLQVNPATCLLFGKPKRAIIGRTDYEILPREAAEAMRQGEREVAEGLDEVSFNVEVDLPEGQAYLYTVKYPIRDASGRVTAIGVLFKDVTAQREAEAAQHEAEEALATTQEYVQGILDNSPVMIMTTDLAGNLRSFNRCAELTLGYSAKEMIGRPASDLYDDPAEREALVRRLMHEGAVKEYDTYHRRKDGTRLAVSVTLGQLQDASGEVIGTVGASRDISHRRHLMNQIIQSERLAAVGRLAAGVAHEINNPLAIIGEIGGYLSDLVAEPAEPPQIDCATLVGELRSWLPKLTDQVRRGRSITSRMLRFARKSEADVAVVDVNKALDEILPFVEKEALLANVTITKTYEDDLPQVRAEEMQLQEIYLNLITNSLHALRERDGGLIHLTTRSMNGKVYVTVEDNGPGIADDVKDRLFDPFVTTKPPGQGTGLGLSICYGIIKRYNGEIRVKSAPGEGASFTVVLPAWVPPRPRDGSDDEKAD